MSNNELTNTEINVLRLIGHGLSSKQIGAQLGLKSGSVDVVTTTLNQKLGTKNRTQIALYAVRNKFVNLDEVQL